MSVTAMPPQQEAVEPRPSRRRWIVAAAVLAIAVVGGYLYLDRTRDRKSVV